MVLQHGGMSKGGPLRCWETCERCEHVWLRSDLFPPVITLASVRRRVCVCESLSTRTKLNSNGLRHAFTKALLQHRNARSWPQRYAIHRLLCTYEVILSTTSCVFWWKTAWLPFSTMREVTFVKNFDTSAIKFSARIIWSSVPTMT